MHRDPVGSAACIAFTGYHAIARRDNAVDSPILARRTFTLADQQSFAALSGDWNPLHVDAIAARRTLFGAPVVHGVHLALWAIDRWLAQGAAPERTRLASLRAVFRKPVYLDTEVVLAGDAGGLRATTPDGRALELTVSTEPGAAAPEPAIPRGAWPAPTTPDELSPAEAAAGRGRLDLAIDPDRARAAFPVACDRLGLAAVAELLATTRLVGMRCPGLHSLFGGLAVHAAGPAGAGADADAAPPAPPAPPAPAVAWSVTGARLEYGKLTLRVDGPTLAGTLDAFYRPPPRRLAMADAQRAVDPALFAGWRALVVGGTRGLGEAFAKAIGAGGGDVCLTYHRGADDAARIVDELRAAGARAAAIPHDVLAPRPLRWPWPAPPTHLFYLAAPAIHSIRVGAAFRASELEELVRYFVTGLHATAAAAAALADRPLVVWTPSTTMLDAPTGAAAYCAAKAAMEELCRHLPALLPVTVHAPRLGRVDTDQTATLVARAPASALDAAVAHLRRLV